MNNTPIQLLTVEQTAAALNTSVRFVRRLIFERRIGFVKLGRHVRISSHDIAEFVNSGRVDPITTGAIRHALKEAA